MTLFKNFIVQLRELYYCWFSAFRQMATFDSCKKQKKCMNACFVQENNKYDPDNANVICG